MRYIGARYVPKFMGIFDPTQEYENMCVVDNGSGTSYISTKMVPPGTPLTDTEYWALYGAASGAIINLQNQIDDMNDGSVNGSLQNQIDKLKAIAITPEMFGAVGDGITDDTQAVKDAINEGGYIYVENEYMITDMIEYDKSIHVFGNGTFKVRSGKPLFFCQGGTIAEIAFEGFTIEGDGVTPTELGGGGFGVISNYSGAIDIQNFYVSNVRFIDVSFGIYLNANNGGVFRNAVVENCYFKNIFGVASGYGDGIAIANRQGDCGAISIVNNFLDNCGRHSIYCSYAKNVTITGNTVINHGLSGGSQIPKNAAINITRSVDIVVSNNFIEKSQNISIFVSDVDNLGCGNVNIENNVIIDKIGNAPDIFVGTDAPNVNGTVFNVGVKNNIIRMPVSTLAQRGITVASGLNIQIEGNMIDMVKASVAYSIGITLYCYGDATYSDNYFISDNTILMDASVANTRGIELESNLCGGTSKVHIFDNVIQAASKITPVATLTNTNVLYAYGVIASCAYIAALGGGASLADVITKVNDVIAGLKTAGVIRT